VEATDDRIQNLEMLEETLHTPILAVLPTVKKALPKKIGSKQITSGFTTSTDRRITALDVPNSAFVEALRGLRTALMHSKRGFAPKVILITSAAENEGKSTVSLNLATVLAQNDARVLLVEADMRHPALSRLFHFDNSNVIGLSSILSGSRQQPRPESFSEIPNLSLLPAGPVASYPSELLGAQGLRTLIEQWSAAYDYVIIDSPPILPVTDALILSRLAELTLLVVRQGVSTRANLKRAYRMLIEDDSSHVGVVLNGISQDSGYYRYKGSKYFTEA
jgi:capsular exopolysaccharide synthesis family protein